MSRKQSVRQSSGSTNSAASGLSITPGITQGPLIQSPPIMTDPSRSSSAQSHQQPPPSSGPASGSAGGPRSSEDRPPLSPLDEPEDDAMAIPKGSQVLATRDGDAAYFVDLSSSQSPAAIKERVFAKLGIHDDEQPYFRLSRARGGHPIGQPLDDWQLWHLCMRAGDNSPMLIALTSGGPPGAPATSPPSADSVPLSAATRSSASGPIGAPASQHAQQPSFGSSASGNRYSPDEPKRGAGPRRQQTEPAPSPISPNLAHPHGQRTLPTPVHSHSMLSPPTEEYRERAGSLTPTGAPSGPTSPIVSDERRQSSESSSSAHDMYYRKSDDSARVTAAGPAHQSSLRRYRREDQPRVQPTGHSRRPSEPPKPMQPMSAAEMHAPPQSAWPGNAPVNPFHQPLPEPGPGPHHHSFTHPPGTSGYHQERRGSGQRDALHSVRSVEDLRGVGSPAHSPADGLGGRYPPHHQASLPATSSYHGGGDPYYRNPLPPLDQRPLHPAGRLPPPPPPTSGRMLPNTNAQLQGRPSYPPQMRPGGPVQAPFSLPSRIGPGANPHAATYPPPPPGIHAMSQSPRPDHWQDPRGPAPGPSPQAMARIPSSGSGHHPPPPQQHRSVSVNYEQTAEARGLRRARRRDASPRPMSYYGEGSPSMRGTGSFSHSGNGTPPVDYPMGGPPVERRVQLQDAPVPAAASVDAQQTFQRTPAMSARPGETIQDAVTMYRREQQRTERSGRPHTSAGVTATGGGNGGGPNAQNGGADDRSSTTAPRDDRPDYIISSTPYYPSPSAHRVQKSLSKTESTRSSTSSYNSNAASPSRPTAASTSTDSGPYGGVVTTVDERPPKSPASARSSQSDLLTPATELSSMPSPASVTSATKAQRFGAPGGLVVSAPDGVLASVGGRSTQEVAPTKAYAPISVTAAAPTLALPTVVPEDAGYDADEGEGTAKSSWVQEIVGRLGQPGRESEATLKGLDNDGTLKGSDEGTLKALNQLQQGTPSIDVETVNDDDESSVSGESSMSGTPAQAEDGGTLTVPAPMFAYEDDDDDEPAATFVAPMRPTTSSTSSEGRKPALKVVTDAPSSRKGPESLPSSTPSLPPSTSDSFHLAPPGGRSSHKASPIQRHKSFKRREDDWAFRPPVESVLENLEEFFPEHDLDKPIDVGNAPAITVDGSSPASPSDSITSPSIKTSLQAAPAPAVSAATQNRLMGRARSIRIVAQERKRLLRKEARAKKAAANAAGGPPPAATGLTGLRAASSGSLLRRKSTKLWGARTQEVTPGQSVNISTIKEEPEDDPENFSFKWVKGDLIGKGSFGQVYLALNATNGEMLAVKQVELPKADNEREDVKQKQVVDALKSEISLMRDLEHPHIVQYLGFEETTVQLSIFLEYVPGGSVGRCLRKHGAFETPVIQYFTYQILEGLKYLHVQNILHRDLKADNLLVDLSGIVKISDFGISKKVDNIYQDQAAMSLQGSIFWMAPEVVHNPTKKGYSAKVDIWSLGCVVLEMFAGRRPWSDEEAIQAMFKLGAERLRPPVPPDVTLDRVSDHFLTQCFLVDPEARPTADRLTDHRFLELNTEWRFEDSLLYRAIKLPRK